MNKAKKKTITLSFTAKTHKQLLLLAVLRDKKPEDIIESFIASTFKRTKGQLPEEAADLFEDPEPPAVETLPIVEA